MGNKLKSKSNGGSLSLEPSRQAEPEGYGGVWSGQGAPISSARWVANPSNNMEGGRHHLNLPHHQDEDQLGGTPALWSTAGLVFVRG